MLVEDSKKLEQVLLGLGIILLIVAAVFGVNMAPTSNTACGFAIAAGLCFVSAAIIHTKCPS